MEDAIVGPRRVWKGLPQGTVLSTLLYIVYVSGIEEVLPDNVKILQYADDVCLYCTHPDFDVCKEQLSEAVLSTVCFFNGLGLSISIQKSTICLFTRRRINVGERMILGGLEIPCSSRVKFLGIHLTRRLNWNAHVEETVTRAEAYTNVLRSFTSTSWGADPSTSMLFYYATVRSVMDYGAIFYASAAKSTLSKLDRVQYRALRAATGALKSTPIAALLAEAGEPPLELRRELLANRYLMSVHSKNESMMGKIRNLAIDTLTERYWMKKETPLICESFLNWSEEIPWISLQSLPLRYSIPYSYTLSILKVTHLPQTAYSNLGGSTSDFVNSFLSQKWPDATIIYTDGSKIGSRVGCAFYDASNKIPKSFRLWNRASVYSAEAFALAQALSYADEMGESCRRLVLLTDSQSIVTKLSNTSPATRLTYLEADIIKKAATLRSKGKTTHLVWIRGHQGIRGNCIADKEAKKGTMIPQTLITPPCFPPLRFELNIRTTS